MIPPFQSKGVYETFFLLNGNGILFLKRLFDKQMTSQGVNERCSITNWTSRWSRIEHSCRDPCIHDPVGILEGRILGENIFKRNLFKLNLLGRNLHKLICSKEIDLLCRQQIKLFQVVSTSEFHEYQWNNVVFIFFVPSGFWWASEASNIDCFKN